MRSSTVVLLALVPGTAASSSSSSSWIPRGGSTKTKDAIRKYRMEQQQLMQLRSTILSEELAKRGIPLPTLEDVSTPAGQKEAIKVDWDCAISTKEEPKRCLYFMDAQENKKVLAPIDTDQWMSVSALNDLRRKDPSKVETMWHDQYAILESWFSPSSPYSISSALATRPRTLLISFVLDQKWALKTLLVGSVLLLGIVFLPLLEALTQRLLVSGVLWKNWIKWARFARAALPLKLFFGQVAMKACGRALSKAEERVRERLIDMETQALEESLPLTVGPGSEVVEEEEALAEAMDSAEGGEEDDELESDSEEEDDDEYDEYDEYEEGEEF